MNDEQRGIERQFYELMMREQHPGTSLDRRADGTYRSAQAELMFRGWIMCAGMIPLANRVTDHGDALLLRPNDCMLKVHADEPHFTILGRDRAAVATVDAWITNRVILGMNKDGDPKLQGAHDIADQMSAYYLRTQTAGEHS